MLCCGPQIYCPLKHTLIRCQNENPFRCQDHIMSAICCLYSYF
jgi:hypothetical protein